MDKFSGIAKIKKINHVTEIEEEFDESLPVASSDVIWFEKYRPKSLEDIVVTESRLQVIRDWFMQFAAHTTAKRALLFTGPPGLGKTSMAHIVLREFGYHVKEFNASDIRSQTQVKENMQDLMYTSNVIHSQSPIGIIMDEVDGMLTGDRGGVEELISFIKPPAKTKKAKKMPWGPPIICICNTGNAKQSIITDLRKHCVEIPFTKPVSAELSRAMTRVIEHEHLIIDNDAKDEIIKYSQGDYRRLMCLLQHLHTRYGKNIIKTHVTSSYHIFCQKEQDLHVKDSIKRVLNTQLDYNTAQSIYYRDKSKAPMVMHHNYIRAIDAQKTSPFDRINNAINVIESLVDSDIIEKTMYNTQGWHLQAIQGLTCCYVPSYYINKSGKSRVIDAGWTEVLGTSSHTQSSKKKIQEIMRIISKKNSYSNTDIQFLGDTILYLFYTNRDSEAVEFISNYNLIQDMDDDKDEKKPLTSIIDKFVSISKLSKYSEHWKARTTGEKNKIEQLLKAAAAAANEIRLEVKSHIPDTVMSKKKLLIKPCVKAASSVATSAVPATATATATEIIKESDKNPKRRLILTKKCNK